MNKQFTDKIIFHTKNTSPNNISPNITEIQQLNIQTEIIENIQNEIIENIQNEVIQNEVIQTEVILDNKIEIIENIQTKVIQDNKTEEAIKNISNLLNIDIDDIEDDL